MVMRVGPLARQVKERMEARVAELRTLTFEDLPGANGNSEKLGGRWVQGFVAVHVDRLDEDTLRVAVQGVMSLRFLGSYSCDARGFRRKRSGEELPLTETDMYDIC